MQLRGFNPAALFLCIIHNFLKQNLLFVRAMKLRIVVNIIKIKQ